MTLQAKEQRIRPVGQLSENVLKTAADAEMAATRSSAQGLNWCNPCLEWGFHLA